jgi:protein ImuB
VEEDRAGDGVRVYLEARGVVPRYDSEAAWGDAIVAEAAIVHPAPAYLGLAGSKFAAQVAAQSAPDQVPSQIVNVPDAAFLAPLPIGYLPLSEEAQRRLRLLGLRTIGAFAALPRNAVAEQFGAESLLAHLWAKGMDARPVVGRRRQVVEAQHTFEVAEARGEALLEAAFQLGQRALEELPPPRAAWAIRWVTVEGTLSHGEAFQRTTWLGSFPAPEALRTVLRNLLSTIRGEEGGVETLTVRLLGLEPGTGRQLDLFTHAEARRRLEEALVELAKKHSASCLAWPALFEEHAPLAAERYGLRPYAP